MGKSRPKKEVSNFAGTKYTTTHYGNQYGVNRFIAEMGIKQKKAYRKRLEEIKQSLLKKGSKKGKTGVTDKAKKKLRKEVKQSSDLKAWRKAKTPFRQNYDFDAEGNTIYDKNVKSVDDSYAGKSEEAQARLNKYNNLLFERSGVDIGDAATLNAADRWNMKTNPTLQDDGTWGKTRSIGWGKYRTKTNPYGEGTVDMEKWGGYTQGLSNWTAAHRKKLEARARVNMNDYTKEGYAALTYTPPGGIPIPTKPGREALGKPHIRSANKKAQAAPPPNPNLGMSEAQATTVPSIATPKETTRKAVPHVSRRIKQKSANRSAGIRT